MHTCTVPSNGESEGRGGRGGAKEGGGVPSVVSGLTACVGELQS